MTEKTMTRRGNAMLNQEMLRNRQTGLCQMLQLKEENVRFVLLAIFLYIYLVLGALVFQAVEQSREKEMRSQWETLYQQFLANFSHQEIDDLHHHQHDHHQQQQQQNQHQLHHSRDLSDEVVVRDDDDDGDDGDPGGGGGGGGGRGTGGRVGGPAVISRRELDKLLVAYGQAVKGGALLVDDNRERWDYLGSFYFAWTIVSTIGYGATTPGTVLGKLLIIPYGFLGCAGGLLFFNLFLERIITFLATCMRFYRIQRQKRRPFIYRGASKDGKTNEMWSGRRTSHSSVDNGSTVEEADWKPSVYWVMLCLFIMSAIVIFSSAAIFRYMEGWSYIESLYFCFVSYATIGFGDLVLLQKDSYDVHAYVETIYRIGAFVITVFGCCCIYSLLNVTSIVIKQSLNWIIKGMDCQCCFAWCQCSSASIRRRFSARRSRRKRRAISGGGGSRSSDIRSRGGGSFPIASLKKFSLKSTGDSGGNTTNGNSANITDFDERRCSGEMLSIPRELNSKVSLAVMQKRLYETAQAQHNRSSNYDIESRQTFSATSIGPLAIVTEKLGDHSLHGYN